MKQACGPQIAHESHDQAVIDTNPAVSNYT